MRWVFLFDIVYRGKKRDICISSRREGFAAKLTWRDDWKVDGIMGDLSRYNLFQKFRETLEEGDGMVRSRRQIIIFIGFGDNHHEGFPP